MKHNIVQVVEMKMDVPTAAAKARNGTGFVGYRTGNGPALLLCISEGGSRDPRSKKPAEELWGFSYLTGGKRDMKFVTHSATDSISMFLSNNSKSKLAVYDTLTEFLADK